MGRSPRLATTPLPPLGPLCAGLDSKTLRDGGAVVCAPVHVGPRDEENLALVDAPAGDDGGIAEPAGGKHGLQGPARIVAPIAEKPRARPSEHHALDN